MNRETGTSDVWPVSTRLFAIHHINAYEDESTNRLVLDVVQLFPGIVPCSMAFTKTSMKDMIEDWKTDTKGKAGSKAMRLMIPLDRVGETVEPVQIGDVTGLEFPTIRYDDRNGKPYDFVYACLVRDVSSGYYDSILKMNVQTGEAVTWPPEGTTTIYPNEPVFVPRPNGTNEDDGVVMTDVIDTSSNKTYLVILDATTMTEIGRAGPTPIVIPHGFHGRYFGSH